MSSSSEDEGGGVFTPYSSRPEWNDVEPVEQEDGGKGEVVAIMYSDDYRVTMDYFRAVVRSGEVSERVFKLTTDCLILNPANYTVWHYRRKCIKEVDIDVEEELEFVEKLAVMHPKNYQLWFHRQVVVDMFCHHKDEDRFTRKALVQEPKNYHAWGYRQWVVKRFHRMQGELDFVDELLKVDARNNSAWNHRHFVVSNTTTFDAEGARGREMQYAMAVVRRTPNNESAWNYLRGCVLGSKFALFPVVEDFCKQLRASHIPSPFIAETLTAIYEEQIKDGDLTNVDHAHELLKELVKFDAIRENYWTYRASLLPPPSCS